MSEKNRSKLPGVAVLVAALGGTLYFATPAVRDFTGGWESGAARVLVVYPDRLAGNLPTVCDGLTRHVTSTPIIVGQRWTEAQCEREERTAWIRMQSRLVKCFTRLPPQSVFDMASSHAWNNGVSATCGSGAMRAWNAGDFALGCRRLAYSDGGRPVWSYVKTGRMLPNGKPEMRFVQGLANRRIAESKVCPKFASYNPGPVQ